MSLELKSNNHQNNLKEVKPHSSVIYEFEDFRLDTAHLMLSRNGEEISLTPKVVETLLALVERSGEIVSKDELMDRLWANAFVEESNLVQNIYVLRKTLGETTGGKPLIETLRRRGYRFNGELKENKQAHLPL
ncbi:MAG: transcriptional regulator, partial [Acidobacteria bacterium]|nr:transcriptional regulator [Acidobacteriota bacterium]